MTMTKMEDQAKAFLGSVMKAIEEGHGEAAYQVGDKAIDLVCDGFLEAIMSAGVCEGCKDKIGLALEPLVEQLEVLKGEASLNAGLTPVPMCKVTPEAIEDHCPTCGCKTDRVDPDPSAVQGSDLGRPKFVCPKCESKTGEIPSSYCWRCSGRGWVKGISAGGSRIVKEKCGVCEGTGER